MTERLCTYCISRPFPAIEATNANSPIHTASHSSTCLILSIALQPLVAFILMTCQYLRRLDRYRKRFVITGISSAALVVLWVSKDGKSMLLDAPIMIPLGTAIALSLSAAFHSVGRLLGYQMNHEPVFTVDKITSTLETIGNNQNIYKEKP